MLQANPEATGTVVHNTKAIEVPKKKKSAETNIKVGLDAQKKITGQ